ncbi:MAG: sulfatase [Pseudomonadota bacterium]
MKKRLLIPLIVVASAGALYVLRLPILLHATGWISDFKHPRAPNRPVPWQQGPATASADARPPNVIVILIDDMGINDVSSYGGGMPQVPTPHIDRLATEGVRFDRGYAANAVCSPSRASLMTGRYATRFGFEFTPTPGNMAKVAPLLTAGNRLRPVIVHKDRAAHIAPFNELGMPPSEVTIAEVLKTRGYHTAHIGKWHLGGTTEFRPNNQGFDETLFMENGLHLPQDSPEVENSKQDFDPIDKFLWPNMRYAASYNGSDWFEPKGYLADYYTDEAIKVIEANRNQPFFLYLAHWGIHTPLQALKSDYDALPATMSHRERVYGAMVVSIDRSVGRILAALKAEGLDDNTLVVFTSDNGAPGYIGLPEVNKPYRGFKLTLFEGGVRVPYLARWPGRLPAGVQYPNPVSSIDLLPTIAAAAGAELPKDRVIDGVNLLPHLTGAKAAAPHEVLFWRDGSYEMVLAKGWKLQQSQRPAKTWLFHLDEDPTEQRNLAESQPEKVAELRALLAAHNAQMKPALWPSFVEFPVMVDKTLDQPEAPEDDYVYWQN